MSRRHAAVAALVLAACAVVALVLGVRRLTRTGAPVVLAETVRLEEVEGEVERRAPGGGWEAVESGFLLAADDYLRTGVASRAVLRIGDLIDIDVASSSELSIRDLAPELMRLRLHGGRLSAAVSGRGARLRVETRDGSAFAESGPAAFSVSVGSRGAMAVATHEGEVQVGSREGAVALGAGQQVLVRPGEAPGTPVPIPASLFLKVDRPPAALRERSVVIAGRTTPYAVVSVNGVEVPAGVSGEFRAAIALHEGPNQLVVEASDAVGRRERAEVAPVLVDTQPPAVKTRTDWHPPPGQAQVKW